MVLGSLQLRFEEFKHGIRGLIMEQFFNHGDLSAFFSKPATQLIGWVSS